MILSCLRQSDAGVELRLYVQPRASRNRIIGIHRDELKVALTAPPVDGAANKVCREFIAKTFKIPRTKVSILSGKTSRHKRLLLEGVEISSVKQYLKDCPGLDMEGQSH